ncbi:hypothetical protein DIPPA_02414 [Diplonema papillatum]|nr:hypothetical protein DIPPA_02414 [Diplonema papillatum]
MDDRNPEKLQASFRGAADKPECGKCTKEADPPVRVSKKTGGPTCVHNSWDNVQLFKRQATFRCRVCDSEWSTRQHPGRIRSSWCRAFSNVAGCALGDACPMLHVHRQNLTVAERIAGLEARGYTIRARMLARDLNPPTSVAAVEHSAVDQGLTDQEAFIESQRLAAEHRVIKPHVAKSNSTTSSINNYYPVDTCDSLSEDDRTSVGTLVFNFGQNQDCDILLPECSAPVNDLSLQPRKVNAPRVSFEKPCTHNRWENVRVKKRNVTLRCVVCLQQWRQVAGTLDKCQKFPLCDKLLSCEQLHVYTSKKMMVDNERAIAAQSGSECVTGSVSSCAGTSGAGAAASEPHTCSWAF